MALQLQIYVDLGPNSFSLNRKRGRRRTIARAIGLRYEADEFLSVGRESPTSADIRVSFTEKGSGMPCCSVAAPGYSSLLRRVRRQEMSVKAGDRCMQIAEWVYRKVKDPMVEIDPVTVDKTIKAEEEQQAREEQKAAAAGEQIIAQDAECQTTEITPGRETIATVTPAAAFVQPLSGIFRANFSTKLAGAALIFAALFLAYLGFRSKSAILRKSKQISESLSTSSSGPAGLGNTKDAGTSSLIMHHSPNNNRGNSPPQDLHAQFRYPDDAESSSGIPVALRASAVLTPSWQLQTVATSAPAVSSPCEKETPLPSSPGVKPTGERIEKTVASPEVEPAPAKPFEEEVVAANGSGNEGSDPAGEIRDSGIDSAKRFEEVVESNGVGLVRNSGDVADPQVDSKAFAEVVDFNGVGTDRNPVEVAISETVAEPFDHVVAAVTGTGRAAADSETEAVEFQNALIFDRPQATEESWPEEYAKPAFKEETTSATVTPEYGRDLGENISEVELSSVVSDSTMLSEAPVSMAPTGLRPVHDDLPAEAFVPQLSQLSLDIHSTAQAVPADGSSGEIVNGEAAAVSEVQLEREKRKSYAKAIQAVVPAIAVGVGAVSTLIGVTSGLQMVGLVATASFLAQEMVMASTREQLLSDLSNIKDHKSFVEFLKSRQIISDLL